MKYDDQLVDFLPALSPSVRRVLVEIVVKPAQMIKKKSPSVRRVLVEIEIYNEAGV